MPNTSMRAERLGDIAGLAVTLVAVLGCAWLLGLVGGVAAVGIGFLVLGTMALRFRAARPAALPLPALAGPSAPAALSAPVSAIVERLPDPLLLLDAEGRILLSNGASHPLIAAATPNRHISGVLRSPRVLEAVEEVLKGGPAREVEYSVPVPIERHLLAYVAPIRLPSLYGANAQTGTLIVVRDLTAQRRVEQMRADFVANASHELRTPLASLSGFIETLRGHAREDAAARERFLEIMTEQAARMRRLIEDLLSLSRIELNEHVTPENPVRLEEVMRDVVDGLMPQARERKVEIHLAAPDQPCIVRGERDELYQVFQNLIDNALKYGARGGRIDVDLNTLSDTPGESTAMAVARVRDYGDGIDREHIPRLTERFYRVDIQHSREKGGTGLGLAIVKHIVNRHRGSLSIESRKGEGSTFSVYLPCTLESGARGGTAAGAKLASGKRDAGAPGKPVPAA